MDFRLCKEAIVNWSNTEGDGETYLIFTPVDDVKEILYHEPKGEGDRHFVDVCYTNGDVRRLFNLNSVTLG